MPDDVHYVGEEDIDEAMNRMENEGGGVVPQNMANASPVLRGQLVDTDHAQQENNSDEAQ